MRYVFYGDNSVSVKGKTDGCRRRLLWNEIVIVTITVQNRKSSWLYFQFRFTQ